MLPHNFLDTPQRHGKPRQAGWTALIDNGVPTHYFMDVVRSDADLIDVVKFGWCTALVSRDLELKIQCLLDHDIHFYFGGTLFEKALSQNRLDGYYRFLKRYRCEIVEISNGTLPLTMREKARHIADFAREFCVLSEVGKKDSQQAERMSPSQWIDEIQADLQAGAARVILEARESGKSGICDTQGRLRTDVLAAISSSGLDFERAIWEAPTKSIQTRLIQAFGANVNLANIPFGDVIGVETLRLGLRSDTFDLYESPRADAMPSLGPIQAWALRRWSAATPLRLRIRI